MRGALSVLLGITAASSFVSPVSAQTQSAHQHAIPRLGTVEFRVDCNPAAQAEFNTAMALYHSFAWPQAVAAFTAVARTDPACGMAHWGLAMSILENPFAWPALFTPARLDSVVAALDAAQAAGLKSKREQDYVAAAGVFVRGHATKPYPERIKAFDAAMASLMATYPDDTEAKILSALITSANFDPTDKNYTNQLKAAAILEPLFKEYPNHPGVAHYLIHSYDYPPIAEKGLPAAKAYAAIAPDAPHALHMPSHIFTRVGYWKESIAANRESARVSGETVFDGHHASDYMVYAHLQLAQDAAARQAMAASRSRPAVDNFGAAYAYAAMPARLLARSGRLGRRRRTAAGPEQGRLCLAEVPAGRGGQRLCPRHRRGPERQRRRRARRTGTAPRPARCGARRPARLLGGPDRHPGRRGCRLGALCGGQVRCLHHRAQGGSRAGRRHRKARRHAGPVAAGARAIGRNLAGGNQAGRVVGRV